MGVPTQSRWRGTLGGSENFGGRIVYETGAVGTDSCWYVGSPFPAFTHVGNGTWGITESNQYQVDDIIGMRQDVVTHYRQQGRAPCSAQFPQTMKIDCNAVPDITYETHQITVAITPTKVSVTRDGVTVQRTWP